MSDVPYSILIVDDDVQMTIMLRKVLKKEGYEVETALDGQDALANSAGGDIDLVITDIRMPGMDGLEFLKRIKENHQDVPVILMTAFGSIEAAVESMKKGAYHYIAKPFKTEQFLSVVEAALRERKLQLEVAGLRQEITKEFCFSSIIGKSPVMQELFSLIRRVARTKSTVIIYGKSGTGKELVARALHYNSPRADKTFVAFNCAAIPETLLETELFGHAKGAFTDARYAKRGLFVEADGGTLFLDEIGDMPVSIQGKLLRAIQEREIRPVGATKDIKIDVRLVAATHHDLQQLLKEGKIREDLYFRLNVVPISLPELKDRKEDIPPLVRHFINKYAVENNQKPLNVSRETMRILMEYSWPGNVRELENILERAAILTEGPMIQPENLPEGLRSAPYASDEEIPIPSSLENLEKKHIQDILNLTRGNQSEAAKILGIDCRTLYRKIKAYNLQIT
ncbi:MAG TPA: sigma-54-dependent Fis family transcriptional regulator [Proteobacteria bacterium]|nr:sigma-54-dependent Fis family transcriptional regulator [Pseudomonadota bacterium]